jgi:hypothetical protein
MFTIQFKEEQQTRRCCVRYDRSYEQIVRKKKQGRGAVAAMALPTQEALGVTRRQQP